MENSRDDIKYAEFFSKVTISGSRILPFRGIPTLIKKYVTGVTTLDYGCGPGKSSAFLKELGLVVDGVDINSEMIKYAKKGDPGGKYTFIESAKIPVEDNYYDLVFSSFVLQEVSSKRELLNIMREIARVMKLDGTFITVGANEDLVRKIWEINNPQPREIQTLESGTVRKSKLFNGETEFIVDDYFWSDEDYREIIAEAGLNVIETHHSLRQKDEVYGRGEKFADRLHTVYVVKKVHHEALD